MFIIEPMSISDKGLDSFASQGGEWVVITEWSWENRVKEMKIDNMKYKIRHLDSVIRALVKKKDVVLL